MPGSERGSILLVEDNANDMALAKLALRQSGYADEILTARDGAEALDMIFGRGGDESHDRVRPDVILLDLKMPGLEGLSLLGWIRSHADVRLTPVIVFSSSDDPADIRGAYELGANAYVRKPAKAEAYIDTVRTIVDFWHKVNQVAR